MRIKNMATAVCAASLLSMIVMPLQARQGPQGHKEQSVGPNSGGKVSADRSIKGPNASSSFSAAGPRGKSVEGNATSTVGGGKAKGQATVTTSAGRSATAQGTGSVKAGTASGTGSVQTQSGYGVTATGSATKTDTGMSGTGSATTNSGKTATASVNGNQEGGTVSVDTAKGGKTVNYGNQR
jgi:hypothetical protein